MLSTNLAVNIPHSNDPNLQHSTPQQSTGCTVQHDTKLEQKHAHINQLIENTNHESYHSKSLTFTPVKISQILCLAH